MASSTVCFLKCVNLGPTASISPEIWSEMQWNQKLWDGIGSVDVNHPSL